MKRWTLIASGLGMILVAIVATIAAQEPRREPQTGRHKVTTGRRGRA